MMNVKIKKLLVPTIFRTVLKRRWVCDFLAQPSGQVFLLHMTEPPAYGLDFSLPDRNAG